MLTLESGRGGESEGENEGVKDEGARKWDEGKI